MPYNAESLKTLCDNVSKTQDFFNRQILIENPSTYIAFKENEMEEYELMNAVAEKTGCKILLDINNIYVQAHNHQKDPYEYIDAIKAKYIGEIHLAGFSEFAANDKQTILIDTHSKPVHDPVWELYGYAIEKLGHVPTLIEWDDDLPPLSVLLGEAEKARNVMQEKLEEPLAAE